MSDLTVEVYALGGVIRPNLADSMFNSPARTGTSGTAEQDFTARGSDLGFNQPWMPTIEGGAIVFPCRFFGIGVHGGGSWSGLPDGQPTSPQLAQRTTQQLSMMRMSLSLHGQLPISRYFVLRASALIGYRNYALGVAGNGQREALLEQVSLEPRLEARLRLPLAVPFGVAAFVGGEVLSQPALTVGGGLFIATDWPDPIRRGAAEPTPDKATTVGGAAGSAPENPPPVVAPPVITPPPVEAPQVVTPVTPIQPVTPVTPIQPVTPPPIETPMVPVPVTPPPVETPVVPAPVTPPPSPTPTVTPPVVVNGLAFMDQNATGLVNTQSDVLNVRSGPAKTAPILGTVAKGARVNITGVAPGWYRIRFKDGIGYVSGDFILREP